MITNQMHQIKTTPQPEAPLSNAYSHREFPPFSLPRLLKTVFTPIEGSRVCILIDLPDPSLMKDFSFLKHPEFSIQTNAYHVFYEGLKNGVLKELGLIGGEMFAYAMTGGSNLDLPENCVDSSGNVQTLEEAVYSKYNLILCVSTYSATAPLTASAKQFGFRGATLHGLNATILRTGLAVDYNEVSVLAERFRAGLTRADRVEIDFEACGEKSMLRLELGRQEAQKSHGLCPGTEPDVANLPAGEVYFVPTDAEGTFPMKYEDGTLGMMSVKKGRIVSARLLSGDSAVIEAHNHKLTTDPVTGELGELGFGTQELPPSGRDIQDEKILGTLHVATGRSDHLGGSLTPDRFASRLNATHDDVLFSSTKTPEIRVSQARVYRDGQMHSVIEDYAPSEYVKKLMRG